MHAIAYPMHTLRATPRTFPRVCSLMVAISIVFMMGITALYNKRTGGTLLSSSSTQPSWQQYATFDPAAPIPRQLWQSYRTSNLRGEAAQAVSTWAHVNSNLSMMFHDDAAADAFILDMFGPDVHATYTSFPLAVMRADFWRYAILYARGGIYSDVDTECLRPLDDWFPPHKPGVFNFKEMTDPSSWPPAGGLHYDSVTWADCSLVVGTEVRTPHLCQWTIAAVPGHPVLAKVLELILERAAQGLQAIDESFVHYYTGPEVWTDAVRLSLGLGTDLSIDAAALLELAWTNVSVYRRAKSLGICLMPEWFFGAEHPVNVRHLYASYTFDTNHYVRWREERDKLLGPTGTP